MTCPEVVIISDNPCTFHLQSRQQPPPPPAAPTGEYDDGAVIEGGMPPRKKKRPGLSDGLVLGKKAMKFHNRVYNT